MAESMEQPELTDLERELIAEKSNELLWSREQLELRYRQRLGQYAYAKGTADKIAYYGRACELAELLSYSASQLLDDLVESVEARDAVPPPPKRRKRDERRLG